MEGVMIQEYKCSNRQCLATDKVKLAPQERAPFTVNCWKCHAGQGLPIDEMLAKHTGMFPVGSPYPQGN